MVKESAHNCGSILNNQSNDMQQHIIVYGRRTWGANNTTYVYLQVRALTKLVMYLMLAMYVFVLTTTVHCCVVIVIVATRDYFHELPQGLQPWNKMLSPFLPLTNVSKRPYHVHALMGCASFFSLQHFESMALSCLHTTFCTKSMLQ